MDAGTLLHVPLYELGRFGEVWTTEDLAWRPATENDGGRNQVVAVEIVVVQTRVVAVG